MAFSDLFNIEFSAFAFRDNWKSISVAIGLVMVIWASLAWIAANVSGQLGVVLVLMSFLGAFIFAYSANILKKYIPQLQPLPIGTVGVGSNFIVIFLLCIVGLGIGYFLVTQNLTIALPLEVNFKSVADVDLLDLVYKVGLAPVVEEMFRAVVLISVSLLVWLRTKNWAFSLLVGLLVSAIVFGLFHWLAYQQELGFIVAAIIFGLIAGALMIMSKSLFPSATFHFSNNCLLFFVGPSPLFFIVLFILIAFLIYAILRRRKR